MKKNAILYLGVVLILAIFLLFSIFINRKESKTQEVQSTTTDVIRSDFEDISGDYISSTGEKATVAKNDQNWRIHIIQTKVMYLETFLRIGRKMATIGLLLQNLISQMEIRISKSLF